MKVSKKLYWIIPTIVIIVPVAVNYILTREKVCNYDVAGCGVDWIGFYGSFLGGALSSLIAYYVLLKTIENTNKENYKKQKQDEYDKLCNDLSKRIAQIEVMEVYRVLNYPLSFDIKNEIDRLTTLLFSYKEKSNSSTLKYGMESDEDCREFYDEYYKLIIEVCNGCANLIAVLSKYLPLDNEKMNIEERNRMQMALHKEIADQRSEMIRINAMPSIVFDRAQRYCKRKKMELDKLYLL